VPVEGLIEAVNAVLRLDRAFRSPDPAGGVS